GRKSSKISKNLPKIQTFQGLHEPFGHVRVEKIFQNLEKSSKNPNFSRFARTLRARAGRKSSKISKNLPKIQTFQGLHEPFGHVRVENLPKSQKIFQKSKIFNVCTNPSGTCGSKIFQNLEKSSKISKNLPESRKIFQESKIFKVCTNPSGTCGSKIFQNLEESSKNPNFSRFARTLRARAGRKSSKISRNLPKIQNFQGLHEP